ncbi:MAG: kelch repeat-containing protein [Bacteroidota bacterium]
MKINLLLAFLILTLTLQAQEWTNSVGLPSNAPARHHAVTFSIDGFGYLLTGGSESGMLNDFYKFDPTTEQWETLTPFPGPRRGFAYGVAHEGKGYIGFGFDGVNPLNDIWEYDPTTNEWKELAPCTCPGRFHPAFIANNGKIFIGLGNNFDQGNLRDWWEFDIKDNVWTEMPDYPGQRRHHPYHFSIGDYVYVAFGHGNFAIYNDLFRFDPATDTWDEMASLPGEGRVAGTQFDFNGKGYALSGQGDDHFYLDEGEFWEYDPVTDSWASLPSHPGPGRWAPANFIIDGILYMMSGENINGQNTKDMMKFDLNALISSNKDIPVTNIQVFPNPVEDFLQFEIEESIENITIYNVNGQIVFEEDKPDSKVILTNIPTGVYSVILQGKDQLYQSKFVKQ